MWTVGTTVDIFGDTACQSKYSTEDQWHFIATYNKPTPPQRSTIINNHLIMVLYRKRINK